MAKPKSGPETPADEAPYIFFVTNGAFEPVVTEVPPERKFNSADLFAFRRVRGDIVLSILMLAMALFLIASFAGETGWAKRKLPADMGQYIGIQLGLLDAEGRVARLGTILKQGWFAPMMCLVVMLPSAAPTPMSRWRRCWRPRGSAWSTRLPLASRRIWTASSMSDSAKQIRSSRRSLARG